MLYLLRQLVSIVVLPGTVVLLVPVWLARRWNVAVEWPHDPVGWLIALCGVGLLILGLTLFVSSLRRFAVDGRGTLAPWDPPRRLVVRGPYRYVRNPMISGVVFILGGIALGLRSAPHVVWAMIFAGLNLLFIPLIEEPMLESRFGKEYRTYCRAVPRLIPLVRPWTGGPGRGNRPR
jgi:protein-S-isoprenylcysteine O-methyltransferase Ste14